MELSELARNIFELRNSNRPSRIILAGGAEPGRPPEPSGVLLFKPSSGRIPLSSLMEILDRLTRRYRFVVRAAAWWHGNDIQAQGLMSRHYPGFHRVAHGGFTALSSEAKQRLAACYPDRDLSAPSWVRTPYDLARSGLPFGRLNQSWEEAGSNATRPAQGIQRLDDDSFSLELALDQQSDLPPALRNQSVVVLNGFYGKLEQDFERGGCVALWIQRQPGAGVSWDDLRAQFAGKTNPFHAPPHTVRGDAARGILRVETVSLLANVIHLSANETEGKREVDEVWWEPVRFRRVFELAAWGT
jgi:hypothetical protein